MNATKNNRIKYLRVRLTEIEYNAILRKSSRTTSKKISEYVRRVLLEKPITMYTRNQSFDDFMAEMITLRTELNAIGNNFNQLVKRLHSLQHFGEIKAWLIINESTKQILLRKVDEIKLKIAQINDRWLQ